jgi:hypothetical protein
LEADLHTESFRELQVISGPLLVVDALMRRESAEGAMTWKAIVGLEGGSERSRPRPLVRVGVGAGPGLKQRADEALDLAVALWAVGTCLSNPIPYWAKVSAQQRLKQAPLSLSTRSIVTPCRSYKRPSSPRKEVAEAAISSGYRRAKPSREASSMQSKR